MSARAAQQGPVNTAFAIEYHQTLTTVTPVVDHNRRRKAIREPRRRLDERMSSSAPILLS